MRSKELTVSEISNLWSSYLKNSMELQFSSYSKGPEN
ncbi:DUF3231 family protein [Cytobacillus firmus]|nr:DUF3231 family protein [Cytobacillus firmus]